jgi:hypothetical protein
LALGAPAAAGLLPELARRQPHWLGGLDAAGSRIADVESWMEARETRTSYPLATGVSCKDTGVHPLGTRFELIHPAHGTCIANLLSDGRLLTARHCVAGNNAPTSGATGLSVELRCFPNPSTTVSMNCRYSAGASPSSDIAICGPHQEFQACAGEAGSELTTDLHAAVATEQLLVKVRLRGCHALIEAKRNFDLNGPANRCVSALKQRFPSSDYANVLCAKYDNRVRAVSGDSGGGVFMRPPGSINDPAKVTRVLGVIPYTNLGGIGDQRFFWIPHTQLDQ